MLVLSRERNQRIVIVTASGERIVIDTVACERNRVKLGFDAPPEVKIYREEIMGKPQRPAA